MGALILTILFSAGTGYHARYMELLHVDDAWSETKGDSSVKIGVIEMGFDYYHPDLRDVLIPGYFADGVYHTEVYEVVAHGTAVASVIHALAPVCPILTASTGIINHRLLKLKKQFEKENPEADIKKFQMEMLKHMSELAEFGKAWKGYVNRTTSEAIFYLVDSGVKVINISALLTSSPELDSAFRYAADNDVVIVIGSGNSDREYEDYPGKGLSNVIVVGASTLKDKRWRMEVSGIKQGSNYGPRLTVVAPCESIVVAEPHEPRFYKADDSPVGSEDLEFSSIRDTVEYGATSLATTVVSGLVALIRSLRPDLSAEDVVTIVEKGARDIGDSGYDIYTGYGRVDFKSSIEIAGRWKK